MSYLARLKKLENTQVESIKSTKTDNHPAPALPEEGDAPHAVASPADGGIGKQPVIGDDKNLETPKVGGVKSTKTDKVAPDYTKRCDTCGGTNWGCVGSDSVGETWACLTCHFSSEPTCSDCGGLNIVKDSMGYYCVDCRKRPGAEPPPPELEAKPVRIGVTWARGEAGWLELTNPLTGEAEQIRAKGLPKEERWLLDRLPRRDNSGTPSKHEPLDYTADPEAEKERITDDYSFIGQVKMRDTPIMSGKKWPWRIDEKPLSQPDFPPTQTLVTCPNCKGQRVKHLVTDSMCMACGHRFETDYRP